VLGGLINLGLACPALLGSFINEYLLIGYFSPVMSQSLKAGSSVNLKIYE